MTWRDKLRELGLDNQPRPVKKEKLLKKKTPLQIKKDLYKRRLVRVRNLQSKIKIARKKIAFFKALGSADKAREALHELISLKSKLADLKKKI